MRIPVFKYCTVLASLLVSTPLMAAQSIAQIQSLQGQVWIKRGNENIALNIESEIHTGDSISTFDGARLAVQLWSELELKLDANSEIAIIPGAKDKPGTVATLHKFIKLERGSGCIDIGHVADSAILLQLATRVSLTLRKSAELCLSSNADETHIQLISGSVEVLQAASAMLIALNQPGSEIRFFDDEDYKLQTPSSVTKVQAIPQRAQELYNVYLYSSRTANGADEVNQRIRSTGHHSIVVEDSDDTGVLFRVAITDFVSLAAAQAFVENVAPQLGVNDAWIARQSLQK